MMRYGGAGGAMPAYNIHLKTSSAAPRVVECIGQASESRWGRVYESCHAPNFVFLCKESREVSRSAHVAHNV